MLVSLDLETTGFDPQNDKIIEFGAVKFDPENPKNPVQTLQFLINPQIKIPALITYITNINDQDVQYSAIFKEKVAEIREFIGDCPIIGHNIEFDISFLEANGIEIKNTRYDTCQLAAILLPKLPSYSLEILTEYLHLTHEEKHRALDDSIAAMELFTKLAEHFKALDPELIAEIQKLCEKSDLPLKKLFLELNHEKSAKKIPAKMADLEPQAKNSTLTPGVILKNKKNTIFETPAPFDDLAKNLTKKADKDTYIALPYHLFRELSLELPDDIAKLDLPKNYLSPARLEKFKEQNHFENHEISALIKFILWEKETKTGLLSELTLFREEFSVLENIRASENDMETKWVKKAVLKDENSPAICSHEYLSRIAANAQTEKHSMKKLIIIDFEKFTKSLFFNLSNELKLETLIAPLNSLQKLFPTNQTLENLITKCTILFGLIGILFETTSDNDPYGPKGFITNLEISSLQWIKIKEAILNLITLSQELGEINNETSSPYLRNWKKNLKNLENIFFYPDLETNTIWTEINHTGELLIRKNPHSIKNELNKLLAECENYQIIDENIDLNDNGAFIKNFYGLPEDLIVEKSKEKMKLHVLTHEELHASARREREQGEQSGSASCEPKQAYKADKKTEIFIVKDAPESDRDTSTIPNFLADYLEKYPAPTAVVLNSRKNVELYTIKLGNYFSQKNTSEKNGERTARASLSINICTQIAGSINKMSEKFKQKMPTSCAILTAYGWERFAAADLAETIFIYKIPFDPPSDPYMIINSKNYEHAFMDFQIPRAVFNLKKILNHSSAKKIIILDTRMVKRDYGEIFMRVLNNYGTVEITKLDELIKPES